MSEDRSAAKKRDWRDSLRDAWARRMPPARRRLLVRLGIAVLVFTTLVIVPAYLASQPGFLKRYSSLEPRYRTWSTSVHANVPCQDCHISPKMTARAAYTLSMLGEFYMSRVLPSRQPKFLTKPTNAACSSCHIDLRTVSTSGDLKIPHRAHVAVLRLECVKCHEYLVHEKSPEGKHTPRMATCLSCHDGRTAKNGCTTCHTSKSAPVGHRSPEWLVVHSEKQKELDCKKCHGWIDGWCVDCHVRRPQSHGTKWRSKHPLQVKAHRNCEACHKGAFCIRCHGEVPILHLDPALKLVK